MIKASNQNDYAHIDILLGKDLPETSDLLLDLCVLFLEFAELLEEVGDKLVDENRTSLYEKQKESFQVVEAPPLSAIIVAVLVFVEAFRNQSLKLFEIMRNQVPWSKK